MAGKTRPRQLNFLSRYGVAVKYILETLPEIEGGGQWLRSTFNDLPLDTHWRLISRRHFFSSGAYTGRVSLPLRRRVIRFCPRCEEFRPCKVNYPFQ